MTIGFVVDSSVSVGWVVPAQSSAATESLLDLVQAGSRIYVPALWPFEVANSLLQLVRRKRIDWNDYEDGLQAIRRLGPVIDEEGPHSALGETSRLARRYDLTVYDASYLELATRRRLPLASRDLALIAAAKKCGLALMGVGLRG